MMGKEQHAHIVYRVPPRRMGKAQRAHHDCDVNGIDACPGCDQRLKESHRSPDHEVADHKNVVKIATAIGLTMFGGGTTDASHKKFCLVKKMRQL
ncbi:hypothetical protein JCM14469_06260 [Desulfatiferula olefinivorans]